MGRTVNVYGFPTLLSADTVKASLEQYTGLGSIVALEVRKANGGSRAYANVQFTTREQADRILELGSCKHLWYGPSYLKARERDTDLVQRPRQFALDMDGITLHFGCQVSKEILQVLCEMRNATVKFGFGLRRLYFEVKYPATSYKLQLSYENIWQVHLHRLRGLASSYLVIQLLYGAPRIFQKAEDNVLNYYREIPDDQWVRATDFTPSSSIGQSSHLYLEFSRGVEIPNLDRYFPYYEQSSRPFHLVTRQSFSKNLDLVPIVGPPWGLDLPYKIVFKVCSLVQHGCIPGPVLDANFYELLDPEKRDIALIDYVVEKLLYQKNCIYDPVRWITQEYKRIIPEYRRTKRFASTAISLDAGLVYVRRVQITPSRVYFCGPEINVSNRVLRQFSAYIDDFLRVSFLDEELEKLYSTDLSLRATGGSEESRTGIYRRVLSILRNGIVIGGKKFKFLAFSSSQLRENSVWMFASSLTLTAAYIREWMGDFSSMKNVAKYAARLATIEEVEEYFTNYIVNDSLGIIANAHTVYADREPMKAMAEPCVELAKLFSIAVDFPKTGVPEVIPSNLRVKEYPDFMEKPVKDISPEDNPVGPFTKDVASKAYDRDMEVDGFEDYIDEAIDFKTEYDYKLGNLMDYYGIKTEAELLSGSIMKMSRSFDRRNDAEFGREVLEEGSSEVV
ncbi:hypothetical protein OROMI_014254 [Orobanche minor]